jgi:N6-adenosine-specific RNA methylase IME4
MTYRTIVADPPWPYPEGFGIGRTPAGQKNDGRRLPLPYPSMSVEEICSLRVADLADGAGCHLWLWTTNRYLRAAFDVVDAWGFRYGQTLAWAKRPIGSMLGGAFSPNLEFILFCRRGSLRHLNRQVTCWFEWPRSQAQHSRKPDAFFDLVEQVSPGPYVELFSRRSRLGWDAWGDESLNTAVMAAR